MNPLSLPCSSRGGLSQLRKNMNRKIHPHIEFADALPHIEGHKFRTVRFFTADQARGIFRGYKLPKNGERLLLNDGTDFPVYDLHKVPIVKDNTIRYVARYFTKDLQPKTIR